MSREPTDFAELILTNMAGQLEAAFDRYGIHNNSEPVEEGPFLTLTQPTRWFLVDESTADHSVGYPGDLMEEFISYEGARKGLFLQIAKDLIR